MLSKSEFLEGLKTLPKIVPSKTGKASYTSFEIVDRELKFVRVNPKTNWKLQIDKLFEVYSTQSFINTTVVKKITGGRVNSPTVAILIAMECIDLKGYRIK